MIRAKLIEATADRIRREGGSTIPVDVRGLIAREALTILVTAEGMPPRMRACYERERGRIRLRPGLPVEQERFALAHELGHHALDHGSVECYDTALISDSVPLDEADVGVDFESEANQFAGVLLIPRAECRNDLEAGAKYPDIATKYVVSLSATGIAIENYRFRLAKKRR